MTGLMLLGILITMRYRAWWGGALVVGVAAAVKQPAFLVAVAPSYAIVSGLPGKRPPPHPAVIERYAANHIPTLVTGTVGAVTVHVEPPLAGSPTAPGPLRIH